MAKYNFICSKCSKDIELSKKVATVGMTCPHCKKMVMVPKKLRTYSKAPIAILIIVTLLIGGGAFFLKKAIDAKAAVEKQRIKASELAEKKRIEEMNKTLARKVEMWKSVLSAISKAKLKTEKDFEKANVTLNAYKERYATPDDDILIQSQYDKLNELKKNAVVAVLENLKKKAASFATDNGNLSAAINLLTSYTGDFAEHTKKERLALASKYKLKDIALKKELDLKKKLITEQRKSEQLKSVFLRKTAFFLLRGKTQVALTALKASELRNSFADLEDLLTELLRFPKALSSRLSATSDCKISVKLKNGRTIKISVLGISDGKMKIRLKNKNMTIPLSSSNIKKVLPYLPNDDKKTAFLFLGLQLVSIEKFSVARTLFKNVPILSKPLLEELEVLIHQNEELKKSLVGTKKDDKKNLKQKITNSGKELVSHTLKLDFDDNLSGTSNYSYALTIERLMRFYKIKVDLKYLELVAKLNEIHINGFGAVDARMKKFIDFSKHEGRRANLKIRKIYNMKDSVFRALVRKYNGQAKLDGTTLIDLKGQHTHWFHSGIRREFLLMDKDTRTKARKKLCKMKFVKPIKAWINRNTPICWTVAFGDTDDPKSGMYLIIGYDDKSNEIIYLDEERSNPKRMNYTDAWNYTTGLYMILPRVNK
jgi:DNA-directed RNA polymerase subunit RPC12/RpoP